jgi:hypothetical protein
MSDNKKPTDFNKSVYARLYLMERQQFIRLFAYKAIQLSCSDFKLDLEEANPNI